MSALAAHVRDVWSRLGYLKVAVTSVYGIPLEIDFTKKICYKPLRFSVCQPGNLGHQRWQ